MAVLIGLTVVHRVATNSRVGVGITGCGIRFDLASPDYVEVTPGPLAWDDDELLDWLEDSYGRFVVPCSHCRDREPAWRRLRRERARLNRRKQRERR